MRIPILLKHFYNIDIDHLIHALGIDQIPTYIIQIIGLGTIILFIFFTLSVCLYWLDFLHNFGLFFTDSELLHIYKMILIAYILFIFTGVYFRYVNQALLTYKYMSSSQENIAIYTFMRNPVTYNATNISAKLTTPTNVLYFRTIFSIGIYTYFFRIPIVLLFLQYWQVDPQSISFLFFFKILRNYLKMNTKMNTIGGIKVLKIMFFYFFYLNFRKQANN